MIRMSFSDKPVHVQAAGCYVYFFEEGSSFATILKDLSQETSVDIAKMLEESKFTGKALEIRTIPLMKKQLIQCICIGLGKKNGKKSLAIETLRRAVAVAVRRASVEKKDSLAIAMPSAALFDQETWYIAEQITISANLTNYQFTDYFSDKTNIATVVTEITLCADAKLEKEISEGMKVGSIIGNAVNTARHWIDMPPQDVTPEFLAKKAQEIAKKNELGITVFSEEEINKMGMGGLAGVSRGSDLDCKLIIMEYRTTKKDAPTIAFVGKGITFDSGGLSIKPASSMETMKEDMSGAAAVIVTMEALAKLQPDINIIGLAPAAENLPSGKATRPGDILRFYNGKTAEVKNTDAEGRLILADALSYAVKHYKPDAIIDVATLTGSCAYALGPFFTGLMSMHEDLTEKVMKSAEHAGDPVWRLPMHDDFKIAVKSPVADLCNAGNPKYRAGAITAAHFLQNFVADVPWVHLDIAGSSFDVPDLPYFRPGATGAGVRLLIDLAMNWEK